MLQALRTPPGKRGSHKTYCWFPHPTWFPWRSDKVTEVLIFYQSSYLQNTQSHVFWRDALFQEKSFKWRFSNNKIAVLQLIVPLRQRLIPFSVFYSPSASKLISIKGLQWAERQFHGVLLSAVIHQRLTGDVGSSGQRGSPLLFPQFWRQSQAWPLTSLPPLADLIHFRRQHGGVGKITGSKPVRKMTA